MSRIKKITALTLSAVMLGSAGSLFAACPLPLGWYIEGDVGSSRITNQNYGAGTYNSNSGFAGGANIGYKFMPYFAGEIGYTYYAQAKIKNSADGVQVAKSPHYSYDIAGKGILPLSDSGFELFAKLGAARMNSHTSISNATEVSNFGLNINAGSKNSTSLLYGVGADYSFFPYLQGVIQWVRVQGNNSTGRGDLYSIGLSYILS